MRRRVAMLSLLMALLGAGAAGAAVAERGGAAPSGDRLTPFASCGEYLDWMKAEALPLVDSWTPPPLGPAPTGTPVAVTVTRAVPALPSATVRAATDFSPTNVQEADVDEPDVVKTDGSHLFLARRGELVAVDVRGAPPRIAGRLPLETPPQALFLRGDRAFVLAGPRTAAGLTLPPGAAGPDVVPSTTLVEVDVGRPAEMRVVRSLAFDGRVVAARLSDRLVRLVLRSRVPLSLAFEPPVDWTPQARADAVARNRDLVASSAAERWLPSVTREDALGEAVSRRLLVGCTHVWRPRTFRGFELASVVAFDVDRGLEPAGAHAVATGQVEVYASRAGVYLADSGAPTVIHSFRTPGDRIRYAGSGRVQGSLLSEWSLSEHEDALRVATQRAGWWGPEAYVSVLRPRNGRLEPVGRVGPLGEGEEVKAVRFAGPLGYVVTFRETDPLWALDLSRPERPSVLGELQVPGFSTYLHPVAGERLLGVGRDVTPGGEDRGTQVSLFDVSDPSRPRRLANTTLRGAISPAEDQHHAFLHWPATGLVVLPVEEGAVGVRVGGGAELRKLGTIRHPASRRDAASAPAYPWRSLVVGETLYTISAGGVAANDAATLARRGWLALP